MSKKKVTKKEATVEFKAGDKVMYEGDAYEIYFASKQRIGRTKKYRPVADLINSEGEVRWVSVPTDMLKPLNDTPITHRWYKVEFKNEHAKYPVYVRRGFGPNGCMLAVYDVRKNRSIVDIRITKEIAQMLFNIVGPADNSTTIESIFQWNLTKANSKSQPTTNPEDTPTWIRLWLHDISFDSI